MSTAPAKSGLPSVVARHRAGFGLAVALIVFFAVGLADLRLPGLMYDEAADAVPALEFLRGLPVSSASHVTLLGREFPLMMLRHIGPTTIYTSAAVMALLGPSVEALRLSQLLVGATGLVLLWLLARAWAGDTVAAVAALLCGTMPPFIWWSRAGANYTVPLLPLALGMMLALTHAWRSRSWSALVLAAFLFGAGVTTKILFVWLFIPVALTIALGGIFGQVWRLMAGRPSMAAGAGLALGLGLAPLILHNIPNLDTVRFLLANAGQTEVYGHDNLNFGANLLVALKDFGAMMGGDTLHLRAPAALPLGSVALIGALAYAVVRVVAGRGRPLRLLFLVSAIVGILPASTVTTSSVGATYVFVLTPFSWLLVALVVVDAGRWAGGRARSLRLGGALASVGVAALCANHLVGDALVQRALEKSGGRGGWSDSINALTDALSRDAAGRPAFAMDWGFSRSIQFLSGLAIRPEEVFEMRPRPSPQFSNTSIVLQRDKRNVYLFHPPEQTFFAGRWEVFAREAEKARKTIVVLGEFSERDGVPNAFIAEVVPAARTFDISPTLAGRNATLAGGLTLLGGSVRYDARAREVEVRLQWRADRAGQPDDSTLVHVVRESDGAIVANGDGRPVYGSYPMTEWQAGETVIDPHWIAFPADAPPGAYQVRVGVYAAATLERRPIGDPLNDAAGNSLVIGRFSAP